MSEVPVVSKSEAVAIALIVPPGLAEQSAPLPRVRFERFEGQIPQLVEFGYLL